MLDSEGFDLWADGYDKSVGWSDEDDTYPFAGYKKVLNRIYKEVLSRQKVRVLDIGFGTGTLTARLYEQGCRIWGVDFSPRMLEAAKKKMPDANLFQWDFSKGLPEEIKGQTYDDIIATYSLHHLTDEEKVLFVKELLGLLKEKGKILIGDVAFENRRELEVCKMTSQEEWDDDEIYFVYDEFKESLPCKVSFQKISHCAGIFILEK